MHATEPSREELSRELYEELVSRYGVMLTSAQLIKVLGYSSANAFRQAIARNKVPVPLFQIPARRGRFALARDVALWLSEQRLLVEQSFTEETKHPDPRSEQKALKKETAQSRKEISP
jgi:hypothetical protein